MPFRRQVTLQPAQEQELTWALKHHQKAYVRERAAGDSMRQVATQGLLHVRTEEAVSEWIDRYLADGLSGLVVRKGRGRKPAFSPCSCAV
jgi:hypothetical protein